VWVAAEKRKGVEVFGLWTRFIDRWHLGRSHCAVVGSLERVDCVHREGRPTAPDSNFELNPSLLGFYVSYVPLVNVSTRGKILLREKTCNNTNNNNNQIEID
jgi:hypothetical protein